MHLYITWPYLPSYEQHNFASYTPDNWDLLSPDKSQDGAILCLSDQTSPIDFAVFKSLWNHFLEMSREMLMASHYAILVICMVAQCLNKLSWSKNSDGSAWRTLCGWVDMGTFETESVLGLSSAATYKTTCCQLELLPLGVRPPWIWQCCRHQTVAIQVVPSLERMLSDIVIHEPLQLGKTSQKKVGSTLEETNKDYQMGSIGVHVKDK